MDNRGERPAQPTSAASRELRMAYRWALAAGALLVGSWALVTLGGGAMPQAPPLYLGEALALLGEAVWAALTAPWGQHRAWVPLVLPLAIVYFLCRVLNSPNTQEASVLPAALGWLGGAGLNLVSLTGAAYICSRDEPCELAETYPVVLGTVSLVAPLVIAAGTRPGVAVLFAAHYALCQFLFAVLIALEGLAGDPFAPPLTWSVAFATGVGITVAVATAAGLALQWSGVAGALAAAVRHGAKSTLRSLAPIRSSVRAAGSALHKWLRGE